ncbi:alpha/beta fold hydrolase [Mycobacterium sp.]|uniref:alpha/beta fold hydrolase n=1 Tax=Mycobacterium sp. TaxID=1785 RepID=UPI003C78FDC0
MRERAPIHLSPPAGSGEPMLLLHPFMMSQNVWKKVAPQIADTGRYEVFAPTMAGHNGGPKGRWKLDSGTLADHVERQIDALGWTTAHIVGNSLGGWVAFELERRGRARTITAIAPAGGWHQWSPLKFEIVGKFLAGAPLYVLVKLLGPRVLSLPFSRYLAHFPISASPETLPEGDLLDIIDDVQHCPAYYQLLMKSLVAPGLMELADTRIPTHLVICEKDRVLPHPRYTRHFHTHIPDITQITELDGVGHIPMFEAPDRVADVIVNWVDEHAGTPPVRSTG